MSIPRPCFLQHYQAERRRGCVDLVRLLAIAAVIALAVRLIGGWWVSAGAVALLLVSSVCRELRWRRMIRAMKAESDQKRGAATR